MLYWSIIRCSSSRVSEFLLFVCIRIDHITVNEALRPRFLDLKEGAIVVSLKPFVSSLNARVTERNVSGMHICFTDLSHVNSAGGRYKRDL
jgi:hypothetical protein